MSSFDKFLAFSRRRPYTWHRAV